MSDDERVVLRKVTRLDGRDSLALSSAQRRDAPRGEQLSWMSSPRRGGPRGAVTQDSVRDQEELVHTGGQGDFLGLAGGAQALVEGADDRIMSGGDERGHIQDSADARPSAPDDAPATQRPTFTIERGDADQGGDGFAVKLAQFGHLGEQGQRGGWPDARDAAQQVLLLPPRGAGLDGLAQLPVQVAQILLQPGDVPLDV